MRRRGFVKHGWAFDLLPPKEALPHYNLSTDSGIGIHSLLSRQQCLGVWLGPVTVGREDVGGCDEHTPFVSHQFKSGLDRVVTHVALPARFLVGRLNHNHSG